MKNLFLQCSILTIKHFGLWCFSNTALCLVQQSRHQLYYVLYYVCIMYGLCIICIGFICFLFSFVIKHFSLPYLSPPFLIKSCSLLMIIILWSSKTDDSFQNEGVVWGQRENLKHSWVWTSRQPVQIPLRFSTNDNKWLGAFIYRGRGLWMLNISDMVWKKLNRFLASEARWAHSQV